MTKRQIPEYLERVNMTTAVMYTLSLSRRLKVQDLWIDASCIVDDSIEAQTQQI